MLKGKSLKQVACPKAGRQVDDPWHANPDVLHGGQTTAGASSGSFWN
jgi:hypothetical protein